MVHGQNLMRYENGMIFGVLVLNRVFIFIVETQKGRAEDEDQESL